MLASELRMLDPEFPDHHHHVTPDHSSNHILATSSPSPSKSCDHQKEVAITSDHSDDPQIRTSLVHAESRVHVNPIFESVSYVKKKLFAKLKFTGFGHEDDDDLDDDDDAAQTKSLSMDSMYITPSTNEESDEKLIQATNYFIAAALIASAILAIVIVWLFVGEQQSFPIILLLAFRSVLFANRF